MADETKKGILSRLFGVKKSGCCDIKIEKVTEEKPETLDNKSQSKIEETSEKKSQK